MILGKKSGIDMCEGPLTGKLWRFTVPLILMNALQLLYTAADMVIVGRYEGDAAVAAVGAASPLVSLIVNVFIGFSIGVNVCVGNLIGAKRQNDEKKAIDTAAILGIVSGIIVIILGVALTGPLLAVMDTPIEIFEATKLYATVYFLGSPANLLYNFLAAVLRARGDTGRPLYILTACGVLNVLLNVVFVAGLGLGVLGVAVATVISQYASAIIIVTMIRRESEALVLRGLKIHKESYLKMIKLGLPSGIQGSVFSLSTMVIQSAINSFDTAAVAGNTAASNIDTFSYIAFNAFQTTAVAFIAQNCGAKKIERVRSSFRLCMLFAVIVAMITGWCIYLFSQPLLGVYLPGEADAIAFGSIRMKFICIPYFILAMMDVTVGALRGLGSSLLPTVISVIGSCGTRILWIFTAFERNPTPETLYFSFPLAWAVTFFALLVAYFFVLRKRTREFEALPENLSQSC